MSWLFGLFGGSGAAADPEDDDREFDDENSRQRQQPPMLTRQQTQPQSIPPLHPISHHRQTVHDVPPPNDEPAVDIEPIDPAMEAHLMNDTDDDPTILPALRASLKRKDEQLMLLEDDHHRELQSLRTKYSQQILSLTARLQSLPNADNEPTERSIELESAIIHNHPDYLELHSQYSRLFDEYHHLQAAYLSLDHAQQTLMTSLREEVEYEIRQSLLTQYEESLRSIQSEKDSAEIEYNQTVQSLQQQLLQLQQQQSMVSSVSESIEEESESQSEEIQSLQSQLQQLQSTIDTERQHRSDEWTASYQQHQNELQQSQQTIQSLQEQLSFTQSQLSQQASSPSFDQQVQHPQQQLETSQTEPQNYYSIVNDLQQQQQRESPEHQATIAQLQQQIESLNQQLQSQSQWQTILEQQRGEMDNLRAALDQAQPQQSVEQPQPSPDLIAEIQRLQSIIVDQQQQIQMLEHHLNGAPTQSTVHQLQVQVQALTGELARKDSEMQTMHRTIVSKLEQVKTVIAKRDAQIRALQQAQQGASSVPLSYPPQPSVPVMNGTPQQYYQPPLPSTPST